MCSLELSPETLDFDFMAPQKGEGHGLNHSVPESRTINTLLRQSTPQLLLKKMPAKGSWDDSWAAWAFSPSISAILVTFFISITLPIIFHYFLYRKAAPKQLPTILLLGPSGGGKTTLLTSVSPEPIAKRFNSSNTSTPSSQTANPPSPTPAKHPKQPSASSPPTTHPTKTASAPKTTPPRATSPSSSSSTPRATANYDTMPSPRSKRHQP
jgi:hypothetical protein